MKSKSPEYNEDSRIIRLLDKIGGSFLLSSEERRRRILAVFSLLVMMIVMLSFSIYHTYNRHYIIVLWDYLGFFLSLSILFYVRKKGKTDAVDWMVGSGVVLFCGMTTIFGRAESSIFFWAFLLPIVCFAVTGKKKGLVLSLLSFCINVFLMTAPEQMMLFKPYSPSFVVRFGIIYIIITFGTYYYESAFKMMIKDIQQSEEKYRTILENIEDGYYEV
ncbi:MAG: hypothetical protein JW976_08965, partial [Syntrophaceae bacterium]|nr:hypothetical protein [Syntrophaceae bacterium]